MYPEGSRLSLAPTQKASSIDIENEHKDPSSGLSVIPESSVNSSNSISSDKITVLMQDSENSRNVGNSSMYYEKPIEAYEITPFKSKGMHGKKC